MARTLPALRRWLSVAGGSLAITLATAMPASAAEGRIDHVEREDDTVQILYSLPGAGDAVPDFDSLAVSLGDTPLEASAEYATQSERTVRRTTILTMDVSNSMQQGNRFEEAKAAAVAFLEAAPEDLYVGIVTFADEVVVAQEPSLDRGESRSIIDGLELSPQTLLHEGIIEAVETAGTEGSRSLLVLSDGRDTTQTTIDEVVETIEAAEIRTDVIALSVPPAGQVALDQFARAGNGSTINADDPEALTDLFTAEAEALARQILITAEAPAAGEPTEGTLAISINADGVPYTGSAFVNVSAAAGSAPTAPPPTKLTPVEASGFQVSKQLMLAGVAAASLGFLFLLIGALGIFGNRGQATVEDRIAAYTRKGSKKLAAKSQPQQQGVTAQAVGMAEKALEGREGLSTALGAKLEAAGMAIKPAEWLLAHFGIAFLLGLLSLLISGGSIIYLLVGVFFGTLLPWVYLSFKRSRRIKAFKYGLADTLQLMAGSLSAGLSLAQSVDTVVREGNEPISGEFRRALVEARLGVEIENALQSVGERMQSVDFDWVVMAIRIQREVGGNLSELLNNVAATIREREYLERQVSALSAEGRLSVWILGGLPPGFMAYLLVANPEYLQPLISTTIGYIMLGVMAVLLVSGILWMKKLVKVDV